MSTISDSIEVMLAHNTWANARLVEACQPLTDAQLDRPFEMGLGSLRPTVTHILGAMRSWTDVLAKRTPRERLESGPPIGPARWAELMPEAARDLRDSAYSGPMDELLTTERGGQTYTFIRSNIIVHVTTHGVHHRAQCLNMLRHLGVPALPRSSVMEWTREPAGA